MNFGNAIVTVLLGIVALVSIIWLLRHFLSADARWERRRRRSNTPITSTAKRPTVKFSVRTKKKRRK